MDTVSGVLYMHEREMIHGDLKGVRLRIQASLSWAVTYST